MIFGRSTIAIVGLISAALALIQTLVIVAFPDIDGEQVALVLGAVGSFLGILVAFIANTSATPVNDPQLKLGTRITVTDATGAIIGEDTVNKPA